MKTITIFLFGVLLIGISDYASASATVETAVAAKAKAAEVEAAKKADAANADVDAAEAAAIKAAEVAAKAAEAAKAATLAKKEKAKAAVIKAQEKAAAAKKAIADAAKSGAKSCDDWKQERESKSFNGVATTWLNGFLAGIEVARSQDFLKDTSPKSLYAAVDEYCEAHPFEFISDAGINLYFELARNKGLIQ